MEKEKREVMLVTLSRMSFFSNVSVFTLEKRLGSFSGCLPLTPTLLPPPSFGFVPIPVTGKPIQQKGLESSEKNSI